MARIKNSCSYISSKITRFRSPSEINAGGYKVPSGIGGVPPIQDDTIFPLPKFDFDKGKLWWGATWVTFRPNQYLTVLSLGPPFYSYSQIFSSKVLTDEEKAELIRFLLCLELWETTPGRKEITAQQIWLNSLTIGPDYAKELDDLFSLSWRERDIDSYNFVFPARFLPKWKEDTDDLELSKTATYADPDVLEEFSQVLDSIFLEIKSQDNNVSLPTDEEILFERSTTTSYISETDQRMPHWQASFLKPIFNTEEIRSQRCVVPVFPSGTRDTIIADITANNSIRWMERAMRHILQYVPESAVTLLSSTFEKRLKVVVNSAGYHVLRDIKKCGITYNVRQLFPIIQEKLKKYFPDIRWERFNIYQHLIIRDNDDEWEAQRGYGLGMANHTVTLCNIVIHRMCRMALSQNPAMLPIRGRAIIGNDDLDVVFLGKTPKSKKQANEYLEFEHEIHGRLGNLTNVKKSVVKPFGLFYEQYHKDGWMEKEALVCNAIACAYLAPNIRVAKHYIYSQSDRFTSIWARRRLRALAQYWGAEFFDFRTELQIHFEVGGWLNTTTLGLKTTLRDIDRLSQKFDLKMISFAVLLCKEFVTPPRPLWTTEEPVRNHLYQGISRKGDPKIQLIMLGEKDLTTYYKKLTKFQRCYSSRLDKFESRVHSKSLKSDVESIQKTLLSREPWYAIPENLVEKIDNWGDSLSMTYLDEYYIDDLDPVNALLLEAQNLLPDGFIPADAKWDPKIPIESMDYILKCDVIHQWAASQFSNSGFLPLLEYYLREEQIPICKVIGRSQFHWDRRLSLNNQAALSLFKYDRPPEIPTEETSFQPSWGDDLLINSVDLADYLPNYISPEQLKKDRPPVTTEDLDRLDKLASLFGTREDMGAVIHSRSEGLFGSDPDEDGEGLGGGLFD
jgi:hypothetical protein